MRTESLAFYQNRISTAYQEQVWAVALAGGMNAFIAGNTDILLNALPGWLLISGVSLISVLAAGFVLSRHIIFMRYDESLKAELNSSGVKSPHADAPGYAVSFARWSGLSLYILIIVSLWFIAIRMIAVSA
jgi:hypothetical protein